MNAKLNLLNRENVMIYRKDETTLLKTSYKTLKFRLGVDEHERLLELLRQTRGGAALEELLRGQEDRQTLKLVKMLMESGVLFGFRPGDAIERHTEAAWFPIVAQYWPHSHAPAAEIEHVAQTPIAISAELERLLPDLVGTFEEYGKKVRVYERVEDVADDAFLITAEREDLENRSHHLFLQTYNSGWCGTSAADPEYQRLNEDIHPLLRKFGPFYLLIFTIKRLSGFGRDTFYINENVKFIETDSAPGEVEVVSTSQAPLRVGDHLPIERIDRFERYLEGGRLGLKIANQSVEYGRLKQIGFSAYGIKDAADQTEYAAVGLHFEENGVEAIAFALKHYFQKHTGGEWLVARTEDYYYRKTQLLLAHLDEPRQAFRLSTSAKEGIKAFRAYRNFLENTEICLERHSDSGSYKISIVGPEGRPFGSGRKTIRLREELEQAIVHYICRLLNPDVRIRLPFDAYEKKIDIRSLPETELPEEGQEPAFIENALSLFQERNIRYEELVWSREYELLESGLCVRRIDVGEYSA